MPTMNGAMDSSRTEAAVCISIWPNRTSVRAIRPDGRLRGSGSLLGGRRLLGAEARVRKNQVLGESPDEGGTGEALRHFGLLDARRSNVSILLVFSKF